MSIYDLTDEQMPSFGLRPRLLRRTLGSRSVDGTLTTNVQPGEAEDAIGRFRNRAADLYSQGEALSSQEPDMAPLQEYARQRSQQGDSAMLNALAAQFAGERFQPVQAQFLKRAAASKDPIQAGNGMITPDGQYIQDPTKGRDKKVEFLMQQARQYETMAQTAETARERAEAQRAQNEIMNQIRLMQVDLQRQGLQIRAAGSGSGNSEKTFRAADNLRKEFLTRADKIRDGVGHAQTVSTLLSDPTIARDPTKQISLVFAFGKMLDPESVVRESEYALIANARGLYDSMQQMIPALQTGAKLSPQQLKSMQAVAQSMLNGSAGRTDDLAQYYRDMAVRRGVDPQDVLPSYAVSRPSAAPAGAPTDLAAAAKAELERRKGGQK
jgi:hypothetical protein